MTIQRFSIIGLLLLSLASSAQSQESARVLVLEIAALDDACKRDAPILSGELAKAIDRVGNYQVSVKSSSEMAGVFEKHGEAVPTLWDDSTQKKIGMWLKSDYVVRGTLGKIDQRRFDINLQLLEVNSGVILSTAHAAVLEYNHRLLLNRFAKLLFWARLQIACNLPEYQAALDGAVLQEETKDPDYEIWLVEPGKQHTLEVRARKENYTTFKDEVTLRIAESRIAEARLKYRTGVLEVNANPQAAVFLNDEKVDKTPLRRVLQEGQYTLKLKVSRHDEIVKSFVIAPEETTTIQETLIFKRSSYRRNGIISLIAATLFAAGGVYATIEADKAYNRYLETMNLDEMDKRRNRAKTLDRFSYTSYGVAGAFALWSALEWIGFLSSHEPSKVPDQSHTNHRFRFSLRDEGFAVEYRFQ